MKVQVNVKTLAEDITSKCEVDVASLDLVKEVKEKITSSQMIAFPDPKLMVGERILQDNLTLKECGIEDHAILDCVVNASEVALVQQLNGFLSMRDLTIDELGLLYCYKYGISVMHVLKTLGRPGTFREFLVGFPGFVVDNDMLSLVRVGTSFKPMACADELLKILAANGGAMSITDLCARFVQAYHMSVSSIVNMRPSEFLASDPRFVLLGRGRVGIRNAISPSSPNSKVSPRVESPIRTDDGNTKCTPSKADLFKEAMDQSKGRKSPPSVRKSTKPPRRASVAIVPKADVSSSGDSEDDVSQDLQMYSDLHERVGGRKVQSKCANRLTSIVEYLKSLCIFEVDRVVKGGSVGNGTSVEGCMDASLVFFLKGLPVHSHSSWMPPLLRSMKAVLDVQPPEGILSVDCSEEALFLKSDCGMSVILAFATSFASYGETVEALGNQGPEARKFFGAAFAKESVSFVQKQSGSCKTTIRLLKWWRDQQDWQCDLTRPSNQVMELVAIYAYMVQGQENQKQAVANCMALFAQFNRLRITFTNFYEKSEIWEPLLLQRPLLMDPVNPFVNVADPQAFDPRELMEKAATTAFFY
jgi:hypothetical protein